MTIAASLIVACRYERDLQGKGNQLLMMVLHQVTKSLAQVRFTVAIFPHMLVNIHGLFFMGGEHDIEFWKNAGADLRVGGPGPLWFQCDGGEGG
ncbi:hypothetical protein [Pararhizobium antarcticum]|uniref:hypothetical protein n=1 Tax=Pararhizobium antarcticum TaxID=1798805 RepID=UPI0015874149|nr:hypothetical protein [Pararhizobium antarcticum]